MINPIAQKARELGIKFRRVYTQKRGVKLYNVNPLLADQSVRMLRAQYSGKDVFTVSVDTYPATTSIILS